MITFDEVAEILDEIAHSLPQEFYKYLNGGVNLLPDTVYHPQQTWDGSSLYVMGHYINDVRGLGRYINIYYGSFVAVYGYCGFDRQREELRKILLHEFTHHLESMGGEKDLEHKDAMELEQYKRRQRRNNHFPGTQG